MSILPPGLKPTDPLAYYWNRPVHELVKTDIVPPSPEAAERHTIYSLLTMALVRAFWNGNKKGADGTYPWRDKQRRTEQLYFGDQFGDRYLGHNIACIAVDENGEVIDFDFNHNELYNSSAEHAEARLVRRIFSLNQAYDHWQTHSAGETWIPYANVFNGVTIYTSLESCAQCSGIMTLANLLRVVYLQSDPGQYLVGNILYNLSRPLPSPAPAKSTAAPMAYAPKPKPTAKYFAPEPMSADVFGFPFKGQLDGAYQQFAAEVSSNSSKFFHESLNGKIDRSSSITSFLCTDSALDIYENAKHLFDSFSPKHATYQPKRSDGSAEGVLSNEKALDQARAFRNHAVNEARRGTPHR